MKYLSLSLGVLFATSTFSFPTGPGIKQHYPRTIGNSTTTNPPVVANSTATPTVMPVTKPTATTTPLFTSIEIEVLQFALTLEHLENVFYKSALASFSLRDFELAGFSESFFNDIKFIAHDEETHVEVLTAAIKEAGAMPVAACSYNFPWVDVRGFVTLSSIIEGIGTSAYLGAAPLITSPSILTVAGSILVTEALHTSLQRAAIGEVPVANPFGTPLDANSVFTLAASFITSCPSTNPALPFRAYPSLWFDPVSFCTCEEPGCSPSAVIKRDNDGDQDHKSNSYRNDGFCSPPVAGSTIIFFAESAIPQGSFVTFVSGLTVISVRAVIIDVAITVIVPENLAGQTYVFISSAEQTETFCDAAVLFGPAVLEIGPPPPTIDDRVL